MATYSGFNWTNRQYAVFKDERPDPIMADTPRCDPGPMYSRIGYDINSALCPLPAGARQVGWSPVAVGQVVRLPPHLDGIGTGNQQGIPGLGGNTEQAHYAAPRYVQVGGPVMPGVPILPPHNGFGGLGVALGGDAPPAASEPMSGLGFVQSLTLNVGVSVLSGILLSMAERKLFRKEEKQPVVARRMREGGESNNRYRVVYEDDGGHRDSIVYRGWSEDDVRGRFYSHGFDDDELNVDGLKIVSITRID